MIRLDNIQQKVATSQLLLPCALALALASWIAGGIGGIADAVCPILSIPAMMELNNVNALLRIRSRMVTAIFMVLWGISIFLHPFSATHIALLCMLVCYHTLFRAYQSYDDIRDIYICFLSIGIMTLAIPELALMAVVFLLSFFSFQAMTPRGLMAALLGCLTPFWFWGAWLFLSDSLPEAERWARGFLIAWPPDYSAVSIQKVSVAVFVVALGAVSAGDFITSTFKDKIRVRIIFSFITWMEIILTALMALVPSGFDTFLLLLIMNTSPLAAHFLAQTSRVWTAAVFIAAVAITAILAFLNLWTL